MAIREALASAYSAFRSRHSCGEAEEFNLPKGDWMCWNLRADVGRSPVTVTGVFDLSNWRRSVKSTRYRGLIPWPWGTLPESGGWEEFQSTWRGSLPLLLILFWRLMEMMLLCRCLSSPKSLRKEDDTMASVKTCMRDITMNTRLNKE